jgi:hypothetical protein
LLPTYENDALLCVYDSDDDADSDEAPFQMEEEDDKDLEEHIKKINLDFLDQSG